MAKTSTLIGIQYLRAIAALMVAYFHLIGQRAEYTPLLNQYLGGTIPFDTGVDIFFVISGFIMLVTSRNSSPGDFAVKRLIRIVPLYWVMTIATVALAIIIPSVFKRTVLDPTSVIKSLLFIPYSNPNHEGHVVPLLVPGWSLNFEMFFYLVFAFALMFSLNRRVLLTGAIFTSLVIVNALLPGNDHDLPVLAFYANPRVFEFWLGMAIGWLFVQQRLPTSRVAGTIMALTGTALLLGGVPGLPDDSWRLSTNIISSALILLGVVMIERAGSIRHWSFMAFLGDASYSIYLSHIFALGIARALWGRLVPGEPTLPLALAFAVFSMLLVLAGAALSYRLIEKPLLVWLQRRTAPSPTRAGAAA